MKPRCSVSGSAQLRFALRVLATLPRCAVSVVPGRGRVPDRRRQLLASAARASACDAYAGFTAEVCWGCRLRCSRRVCCRVGASVLSSVCVGFFVVCWLHVLVRLFVSLCVSVASSPSLSWSLFHSFFVLLCFFVFVSVVFFFCLCVHLFLGLALSLSLSFLRYLLLSLSDCLFQRFFFVLYFLFLVFSLVFMSAFHVVPRCLLGFVWQQILSCFNVSTFLVC